MSLGTAYRRSGLRKRSHRTYGRHGGMGTMVLDLANVGEESKNEQTEGTKLEQTGQAQHDMAQLFTLNCGGRKVRLRQTDLAVKTAAEPMRGGYKAMIWESVRHRLHSWNFALL